MSDNENIFSAFGYDSDSSSEKSIESQTNKQNYPLKNKWSIYDHTKGDSDNYEANTRYIGDISNVIEFWQFFNNYNLPSKIFNNGNCKHMVGGKRISSISFFKKGILPNWEDPVNKKGAEVSKRKFDKKNSLSEVDNNWLELLMGCVGEYIDDSVTGIRVVDSSSITNNDFKLLYRVELWFDDIGKKQTIEEKFQILLNLDARGIHYKEHKPRNE